MFLHGINVLNIDCYCYIRNLYLKLFINASETLINRITQCIVMLRPPAHRAWHKKDTVASKIPIRTEQVH
jgi:hypothetical protein